MYVESRSDGDPTHVVAWAPFPLLQPLRIVPLNDTLRSNPYAGLEVGIIQMPSILTNDLCPKRSS